MREDGKGVTDHKASNGSKNDERNGGAEIERDGQEKSHREEQKKKGEGEEEEEEEEDNDDDDDDDDDEPDEWDQRIEKTGCAKENLALQLCHYDTGDWRKCIDEMNAFRKCWSEHQNNERTHVKDNDISDF
ncbi:hypothetical protein BRETT_005190 [Brettanomyces bruxellensis]|uniref:CHCH domain-containing protein n=1 Tax=Dekkera bruxellensis TaxID=5007 RepID=A0A871R7N9_DEKBR|nr:uncharacterized protein BRETT_005190 [Brettanomyces bruxellensis]QOU18130.1 hypothetical protein BRETT_005190 [Brettanomyces bruxellensis]